MAESPLAELRVPTYGMMNDDPRAEGYDAGLPSPGASSNYENNCNGVNSNRNDSGMVSSLVLILS